MKIPHIIHQTCSDPKSLPDEIRQNIEQLKRLNPEWAYRIYSDKDVHQYFADHLDSKAMSSVTKVNRRYGVVLADLFRYLVIYHEGGVYLDIKSMAARPLSEVILPDDEYLLSQWRDGAGEEFEGWGTHPELQGIAGGEFQQWHVIAAPRHPFLAKVIENVLHNIEIYDAGRDGVGKKGVMRVSGPVCYTLAIAPLLGKHPARLVDAEKLGLKYSIYSDKFFHMNQPGHYTRLQEPIVGASPVKPEPPRQTSHTTPAVANSTPRRAELLTSIDSIAAITKPRTSADQLLMDRRRCIILIPFSSHIVAACERGLVDLERRGYEVWRVGGYAAIDAGRSELATKALAQGFKETFWIDSDIEFSPDDVDRVRSHNLPITTGIVARKKARAIATQTLPGTKQLHVGQGGGVCEVLYAGAGFLHIRSEVYDAVRQKLMLPMCNAQFGRPMVPYFQPMVIPHTPNPNPLPPGQESHWYLGEDYAFCERARQCGYKIMADTSIRLWHIGEYAYGWEDAGLEKPRHDSFLFVIDDPTGK